MAISAKRNQPFSSIYQVSESGVPLSCGAADGFVFASAGGFVVFPRVLFVVCIIINSHALKI